MSKIESSLPASVVAALTPAGTKRTASGGPVENVAAGSSVSAINAQTPAATVSAVRHSGGTPVDAAKVARLRAAVLDGSYKPNAGRIADRLAELEKKLP